MFVILPGLLMFPICFELAVRMLRNRQISSWQFVTAAALPYYAVCLYIFKHRKTINNEDMPSQAHCRNEEDSFRQTVLEGEEMLFKESGSHTIGWQVVQFYRSFAITFLSTFMINPMYRQISYIVLLLVFVVHDRNRKPYKHKYLNLVQSLSSRSLVVVLSCNIIPAVSYLVNVRTVPYIYEAEKGLGVVELLVYAAVPLSLPVWKLKTFIENRRMTKDEY